MQGFDRFVLGFRSLVARHQCHLKRLVWNIRGLKKPFWQWISVNSLEIFKRINNGNCSIFCKGETGRCEGRNENLRIFGVIVDKCKLTSSNCEFLARESVNSSPILARTDWSYETSLHVSLSLKARRSSLSLGLSQPDLEYLHAQYRKRFRSLPIMTLETTPWLWWCYGMESRPLWHW